MSEPINLTISSEEFLAAGKTLEGDFSPISPFLMEGGSTPPASLMQNGTLRSDLLPAFQTLEEARHMGACAYMCADGLLDTSFYYPSDGKPAAALSLADEGIKVLAPANSSDVLAWLVEHVGDSLVRSCDFDAELPLSDAHVLFGIVDVVRRKSLAGLAGCAQEDPTKVAITELAEALSVSEETDAESGIQWLAPHLAAGYNLKSPDAENLNKSLQQLARKGYISIEGKELQLSEDLTALASAFLLVEGHLRLRSAEAAGNGKVSTTEVRGIRGRGSAALLWTDDGEKMRFLGVSPAQVIVIAGDFLAGPEGEPMKGDVLAAAAGPVAMESPAGSASAEKWSKGKKKEQNKKKKGLWWKILLIALVLFAILFLLLWILA